MDNKILLLVAIFLFSLSSVFAVDIDSCLTIESSGNYRFPNDMTTNTSYCNGEVACININASNVNLDLNSHSLINDGGCYYGIYVYQKNNSEPTDIYENVNIYNGNIEGFSNSAIITNGIKDSRINNLRIINYGSGNGIYLNQPFNEINIYNNYIETGEYAVTGSGYYHSNIYNNHIMSFNGLRLNGYGFIVKNNLFGNYSTITYKNLGNWITNNIIHSNTSLECSLDIKTIDNAIECDDCHNSSFINNLIISDNGIDIIHYGSNIDIRQNQYYGTGTIGYSNYSTQTITFCSNTRTTFGLGGFDTTNLICYWRGTTENTYKDFIDLGSNDFVAENCPNNCISKYTCNGTNKIHLNGTCQTDKLYYCEYGCTDGTCTGRETDSLNVYNSWFNPYIPLENKTIISKNYTTSVVNQTDLEEAGIGFLSPFFTPVFLIFIFEIFVSTIVSAFSKQAVSFPLTIFILTAIVGFLGLFPLEITFLTCIITALITGLMYKMMTK